MTIIDAHRPQWETEDARVTARDIWAAIQRTSASTMQLADSVRTEQDKATSTLVRIEIPCHLYLSVESEKDLADAIFRLFGPNHAMEPSLASEDISWPSVQIGDVASAKALDLDSVDSTADRTQEWWRNA